MTAPPPSEALRSADDAELVRRMADDREEAALEELFDRYSAMVAGLAGRILGDPADAEEVALEVFVQAWSRADRYDPGRSSVATWLVLLARSRAIDRLRSRRVAERAATAAGAVVEGNPPGDESPGAARHVLVVERRRRVLTALGELPDEQREVLELAYYRGLTQSEIADEAGLPLGTVKTRTLLAMKKLRAALRGEIDELL